MSEEISATPLYKFPPLVDRTKPETNEEIVVEPFAPIVTKAAPVEEATTKGLLLPADPTTVTFEVGVVVPKPILPVEVIYIAAAPAAVTLSGLAEEPEAVVIETKLPVPVLFAVSDKLNKLEEPVEVPQVKLFVKEPMDKLRFPVGSIIFDQATLPPPAPQPASVVLHKILAVPFSTILNL